MTPDARTIRSRCEPPSTSRALVRLIVADAALCGADREAVVPCGVIAGCAATRAAAVTPDCGRVTAVVVRRTALESVRTCIDAAVAIAELRDGG